MRKTKQHGGRRAGAGRKKGQGPYGEKTQPLRCPLSQIPYIQKILATHQRAVSIHRIRAGESIVTALYDIPFELKRQSVPFVEGRVAAGFPSPADDYFHGSIDLNEHLIQHRESTFILRVSGWSMLQAGIHDGDELIVDRSLEAKDGSIVIAVLDNELTCKRLRKTLQETRLLSENPDYPEVIIGTEQELSIWGVVTRVLHKV